MNEAGDRQRCEQRLIGSGFALKPQLVTGAIKVRQELPICAKAIREPARQAELVGFLQEGQAKLRCLALVLINAWKVCLSDTGMRQAQQSQLFVKVPLHRMTE